MHHQLNSNTSTSKSQKVDIYEFFQKPIETEDIISPTKDILLLEDDDVMEDSSEEAKSEDSNEPESQEEEAKQDPAKELERAQIEEVI